jgi:DNA polymerase I-like protein with 3'-5' exonuclease and polymerase domains
MGPELERKRFGPWLFPLGAFSTCTYHPRQIAEGNTNAEKRIVADLERTTHAQEEVEYPQEITDATDRLPSIGSTVGLDTEFDTEHVYTLAMGSVSTSCTIDDDTEITPKSTGYDSYAHLLGSVKHIAAHWAAVDIDALIKLGLCKESWCKGEDITDTYLLARVEDENRPVKGGYGLEDLSAELFGKSGWKAATKVLDEGDPKSWGSALRIERCRIDAWATVKIAAILSRRTEHLRDCLWLQYRLGQTFQRIYHVGAQIDMQVFTNLETKLTHEATELSNRLKEYAETRHEWMGFEPQNPHQVRELFFDREGLPSREKTKSGLHKLDKTTLKQLAGRKVVDLYAEFQTVNKIKSTWFSPTGNTRPMRERFDKHGRLHIRLNVCGAGATLRRSGSNPNTQNWPKSVRPVIGSRYPGGCIGAFDYEKLEVMLLAWVAGSKTLIDYFRNRGGYLGIAKELFRTEVAKDGPKYRATKSTVLGIDYNMHPYMLAHQLWHNVEVKLGRTFRQHTTQCESLVQQYFEMFPEVPQYIEARRREVIDVGQVKCYLGYVRHLPVTKLEKEVAELRYQDSRCRLEPYQAAAWKTFKRKFNQGVNVPIQNLASYVTGAALLDIEEEIVEEWYGSSYLRFHHSVLGMGPVSSAHRPTPLIINEVHDEITMDLPQGHDGAFVVRAMVACKTLKKLIPEFDLELGVEATLRSHWHGA